MFERIVEDLANRVLSMDPAARERLSALLESTVAIDTLNAPLPPSLILRFGVEGIRVERAQLPINNDQVDVVIAATPMAFMSAAARQDFENPSRYGIRVTGNTEVAAAFTALLTQLDIDWEDELATRIGDIPARSLSRFAQAGRRWSRETRRAVVNNFGEFLREESGEVPARHEIEQFLDDVDTVRNRTDSIEVRLARLEADRADESSV